MWRAMETAKHIIYITNWHFNPETKNPFDENLPNIGELLKRKSEEGRLRLCQCAEGLIASMALGHCNSEFLYALCLLMFIWYQSRRV